MKTQTTNLKTEGLKIYFQHFPLKLKHLKGSNFGSWERKWEGLSFCYICIDEHEAGNARWKPKWSVSTQRRWTLQMQKMSCPVWRWSIRTHSERWAQGKDSADIHPWSKPYDYLRNCMNLHFAWLDHSKELQNAKGRNGNKKPNLLTSIKKKEI